MIRTIAFATIALAAIRGQGSDNVLIVIADDLGVDQVSTYGEGSAPPRTTNIDALATRGVLFRNGWAYPTCSPCRASIMTGRHGFRTGVGQPARAVLPATERTLPEALDSSNSGYAHAWIGKWHLGGGAGGPNDAGWSHYAGPLDGAVTDYYSWTRTVNGQSATSNVYATTQIADDAIEWIRAQQTPWLCVLAFNAPHTPFHVPPPSLHSQALTGTPATNPLVHYKAAVEALDTELGRVLAAIGPDITRTNIIFVGDNGTPRQVTEAPFVRSHAKGSPYEGGMRVPFLFAGPAVTGGGREVPHVVSVVDLLATTGELIGFESRLPFGKTDSVSFAPYLSGASQAAIRESVYCESFNNAADPLRNGFACSRNRDFKLIRQYTAAGAISEELYDLANDPFEQDDLMNAGGLTAAQQSARDVLATRIDSVRRTDGRFASYGDTACVGSNGALRALGVGVPTIGASYGVSLVDGPILSGAILAIGSRNDRFANLSLPFDLATLGAAPGCFLHASIDLSIPTTTSLIGEAGLTIPLPRDDQLLAGSIYHCWIALDASAPNNVLGLVTTQGVEAVVGR